MKIVIIGIGSLIFGIYFLIYLLKDKSIKEKDPMGKIAKIKGYFGAVGAIILGLAMIIKEICKL
jgi:hypothetical protein